MQQSITNMNVYEKMECDIFHNSMIDQNDLLKQTEEENPLNVDFGQKELYGAFTTALSIGGEEDFEYLGKGEVKSRIPKYTPTKF